MPGGGGKGGGKGGGGGGGTTELDIKSTSHSHTGIDAHSKSDAVVHIAGLDNVRVHSHQDSDSKNSIRLAITEPIRTESISRSEMDIKPLQAEICLKLGIDRLPSTKICKPLERHFDFSLFGQELFSFNYSEEKNTIVEDLGNRPFVVEGPGCYSGHKERSRETRDSGIKIRLEDI
jgi:hypothetical protein